MAKQTFAQGPARPHPPTLSQKTTSSNLDTLRVLTQSYHVERTSRLSSLMRGPLLLDMRLRREDYKEVAGIIFQRFGRIFSRQTWESNYPY